MKKLKKFVMQDFTRLSRDEMATIEGKDGSWVDVCKYDGQTCLLKFAQIEGHQAAVLGICHLHSAPSPIGYISYYACD